MRWEKASTRTLFGYAPDELIDMARFEASVHPDDRDRVPAAPERSAEAGDPIDVEYRIILPGDSSVRLY